MQPMYCNVRARQRGNIAIGHSFTIPRVNRWFTLHPSIGNLICIWGFEDDIPLLPLDENIIKANLAAVMSLFEDFKGTHSWLMDGKNRSSGCLLSGAILTCTKCKNVQKTVFATSQIFTQPHPHWSILKAHIVDWWIIMDGEKQIFCLNITYHLISNILTGPMEELNKSLQTVASQIWFWLIGCRSLFVITLWSFGLFQLFFVVLFVILMNWF